MKKLLSIFIAFVLCVSAAGLTAFAADEELYYLGDVNADEWVDNLDAVLVLKHDAGLTDLSEDQLGYADVNYDGYVDNMDASLILKYDAGLIYDFCEEHEWEEGNCTTPKTCYWCGLTDGNAPGHNVVDGECTECDYVDTKQEAFDSLLAYIEENGIEEEGAYSVVNMLSDIDMLMLSYTPDLPDSIVLTYACMVGEDIETVLINYTVATAKQEVAYLLMGATSFDIAGGYIDITTFTADTSEISEFEAMDETSAEAIEEITLVGIITILTELEEFLADSGLGYTLADLGYTAF